MRTLIEAIVRYCRQQSLAVLLLAALIGALGVLLTSRSDEATAVASAFAARIDGRFILRSDLNDFIAAERVRIIARNLNDPKLAASELEEMECFALESLIERELIMREFKKQQGAVAPKYVDEVIDKIIREDFQGDRNKLVSELARERLTLKRFRQLQEGELITQVMKCAITERGQTYVAEWLAGLKSGSMIQRF